MKEYSKEIRAKAAKIDCIICDVDGVLTDGAIIYDNNGLELKRFNVKDGQIIKYLKNAGIKIGAITGRDSEVVRFRCNELKMDFHFHGVKNKDQALNEVKSENDLALNQIAFIGDDLNDLPILTQVGLSATPADGHWAVKSNVDLVLDKAGGAGTLRELADLVLTEKGLYQGIIEGLKR